MLKLLFIILNILIAIHGTFGFFERRLVSTTSRRAVSDAGNVKIDITKPSSIANSIFPDEFKVSLNVGEGVVSLTMVTTRALIEKPPNTANMYTFEDKLKHVVDSAVAMESYKSIGGDKTATATATLFNNSYFTEDLKLVPPTKFSLLISITINGKNYEVVTVVYETKSVAKNGVVSVRRRLGLEIMERGMDLDYGPDDNFMENKIHELAENAQHRTKRAFNGQPVQLYVECVLVADYGSYVKHMTYTNLPDQKSVLTYMKIFFSHMVNAINRRYINTFTTDPDIQIQVRLNNIVVHTTAAEATWADPNLVGLPGNASYSFDGRAIVLASASLGAFRDFMNARTFPFTYDHAFGVYEDMWFDTGTGSSDRAPVVGLCYVSGVCGNNRYSVNEDRGFNGIPILAHELGHNLGSRHDGDATYSPTCSTSDNYLMTPGINSTAGNFVNLYKFSPCSVSQFVNTLLNATNGALKSTYSCLANVPISSEEETSYFNRSLPGQLWSANDQCKIVYGIASTTAGCTSFITNICETIWCSNNGFCFRFGGRGAMEGTSCGTNMVCFNGVCVSNAVTLATDLLSTPCAANPCLNGGACVTAARFYVCNCADGYTGQQCETLNVTTTLATTQPSSPSPGATTQSASPPPVATTQPPSPAPIATTQPLPPPVATTQPLPIVTSSSGSTSTESSNSGYQVTAAATPIILFVLQFTFILSF